MPKLSKRIRSRLWTPGRQPGWFVMLLWWSEWCFVARSTEHIRQSNVLIKWFDWLYSDRQSRRLPCTCSRPLWTRSISIYWIWIHWKKLFLQFPEELFVLILSKRSQKSQFLIPIFDWLLLWIHLDLRRRKVERAAYVRTRTLRDDKFNLGVAEFRIVFFVQRLEFFTILRVQSIHLLGSRLGHFFHMNRFANYKSGFKHWISHRSETGMTVLRTHGVERVSIR